MTMTDLKEKLKLGPRDGFQYPLIVPYCGNCTMPIEYCEYYPEYEKCKKWLEKNLPAEFAKLGVGSNASSGGGGGGGAQKSSEGGESAGGAPASEEEEKKRQKRGGKGMIKANKKKEDNDKEKKITVSRAPRGKKKSVTVVTGMSTFGIDLKAATKFFGTKFACGSSVTGDDEIVIQGDVKDELFDIIPEKWPEIDEDAIDDLGDQKR